MSPSRAFLLALCLAGCAAQPTTDAGTPEDAGHQDGGPVDSGTSSGPDSGTWFADGGTTLRTCSSVCAPGLCRPYEWEPRLISTGLAYYSDGILACTRDVACGDQPSPSMQCSREPGKDHAIALTGYQCSCKAP